MTSPLYLQEIFTIKASKAEAFLELLASKVAPLLGGAGISLLGGWEVQMAQREYLFIWRIDRSDLFTDGGWWLKAPPLQPQGADFGRQIEEMTETLRSSFMQLAPFLQAPQSGPARRHKRRRLFFHEITQVQPGKMTDYLGALAAEGLPLWRSGGWHVEGIFRTH